MMMSGRELRQVMQQDADSVDTILGKPPEKRTWRMVQKVAAHQRALDCLVSMQSCNCVFCKQSTGTPKLGLSLVSSSTAAVGNTSGLSRLLLSLICQISLTRSSLR